MTVANICGTKPAVEAIPIDTKLRSYFTVTAKSGDFAFDAPVEIATRRGKPVTLTIKVGQLR